MSEISDFIKSKYGRTSALLVRSLKTYIRRRNENQEDPEVWEYHYPQWIVTVRGQQKLPKKDLQPIEFQRLYRAFEKLLAENKALKAELSLCKKNLKFQSPPAHILRALAEYGD